MSKEVIAQYNRMQKERNDLYIKTLNLKAGNGLRALRDELYAKEANMKKYILVHCLTEIQFNDYNKEEDGVTPSSRLIL
tara:strand:+ start:4697 stop:4933 length:237 start_codon:yes stop_codon:yes gene_type:complete